MSLFRVPGVYVEEINMSQSIEQITTAIPAFIGYTEKATEHIENDLSNIPTRISSMLEYESLFGTAKKETTISISIINNVISVTPPTKHNKSPFLMYYAVQLFFANGGNSCYIQSVGQYDSNLVNPAIIVEFNNLNKGLKAIEKIDEPTLLVFPDATSLASDTDFYTINNNALIQCNKLNDRFVIIDTYTDVNYTNGSNDDVTPVEALRNGINLEQKYLKNGAVYYPFLETILDYVYDETQIDVVEKSRTVTTTKLSVLASSNAILYNRIIAQINLLSVILPPSAAISGVYTSVDKDRGVWKAPANVSLNYVIRPTVQISNENQETLTIDTVTGKSINAIRTFRGKGVLVWGARTLAGNDNEWRYVSVRRLSIMIEESIKIGIKQFVFEPNDQNTWTRVKTMINNFLITLWKSGALVGSKSKDAFFVRLGLGETMTANDVLEGNMIIEIGMATSRPAEFIILKILHKMINKVTKNNHSDFFTNTNLTNPKSPIRILKTKLKWNDLILNKKAIIELKEIETKLNQESVLLNKFSITGREKLNHLALFHGAAGTGKTLAATLLGKQLKRPVYRIDLSLIISKYIGETEKNIVKIFKKAKNKNWILFFDEADSIFGKRTNIRDAHDKFANQEVFYLLQHIETYFGLVILASNFKNNIDSAFSRRFQSIIEFEMPKQAERLRLWKKNLPKEMPLEKALSLEELSRKYTITGSNIVNIVQYACLETLANKEKAIKKTYILKGIKKEYLKEGKTFNF